MLAHLLTVLTEQGGIKAELITARSKWQQRLLLPAVSALSAMGVDAAITERVATVDAAIAELLLEQKRLLAVQKSQIVQEKFKGATADCTNRDGGEERGHGDGDGRRKKDARRGARPRDVTLLVSESLALRCTGSGHQSESEPGTKRSSSLNGSEHSSVAASVCSSAERKPRRHRRHEGTAAESAAVKAAHSFVI